MKQSEIKNVLRHYEYTHENAITHNNKQVPVKEQNHEKKFRKNSSISKISVMKNLLFKTTNPFSPLPIRILLASVLFAHGVQKMFGWLGGYGFTGTMSYFTDTVGLPWLIGFLVIIIEFFGPLFLVFGLATRIWSLAIFFLSFGITVTSHSDYFFMNWFGNQNNEGFEYFLLMMGMSLSLVISGAGTMSVDAIISKNLKQAYNKVFFFKGISEDQS